MIYNIPIVEVGKMTMIKKVGLILGVILSFSLLFISCVFEKTEDISYKEMTSKNSKSKISPERKYISFTVTKEEDNDLNMYTYTYDLKEEKLINRVKLDYNAQYPLAVYTSFDDSVYSSYRDDQDCDQLWRIDLKSKNKECLTESLFAINYIIPLKEKVYVAAVKRGERAIGLFEYSQKKLTRISKNKDDFVWKLNVNPDINKVAYNTYSQSELDRNMEEGDGSSGIGINTINVLDIESAQIKKVGITPKGYITSIGLDSDENIYYNLGGFYKVGEENDGIYEEFTNLDIYDLVYINDNEFYYLDSKEQLMKYDRVNKQSQVIYSVGNEEAALNNAIILYKQ